MTNSSQIPGLLIRLDGEIRKGDPAFEGFIDDLQMFQDHRLSADAVGLKAKLEYADRLDEYESAEQKKNYLRSFC